jgi:polysaccharide export outer membrane protein
MTWLRVPLATICLAAMPWSLSAQSSPPATNSAGVALNPGDVVRITVWRKPELSGEFVVAGDGTLSHPLYREVHVTGIPIESVEARLREYLSKLEANPQFVVEPLLRVAVSGEVRTPNLYNLRPETSLAQAVAMAGGPTERGRRDRVLLVRENQQRIIDLRRADATGAGMPVRSGDQILVEQQRAVFRDFIGPVVNILGATAAVVSVILYNGRR